MVSKDVVHGFAERLHRALDQHGIIAGHGRQTAVAKLFGVSHRAARKWLEGEALPRTSRILEMAALLKVRHEWLLSGSGTMRRREAGQVSPGVKAEPEQVLIPVYNVEANAGGELLADSEEHIREYLRLDRDWFVKATGLWPHGKLGVVRVVGDSMESTLESGDLVLIDFTDTALGDGIFCLRLNDVVMLKRLAYRPDHTVDILSDNRRYPVRSIDAEALTLIGRAVFAWRGKSF